MIIAIDGPAAAGKGTLAERVAAYYRLPYLDTGLLYRLVGKLLVERGIDPDDAAAAGAIAAKVDAAELKDPHLRGHEAGELASRVGVHPQVRNALLAFQRDFARRPGGAVLDGRDIGTVVCPDAEVKIFVTASLEVRSRRRVKELRDKGETVIEARVFADMAARDARDSGRDAAPLKPADDAFVLDTSDLDAESALAAAKAFIESKQKS